MTIGITKVDKAIRENSRFLNESGILVASGTTNKAKPKTKLGITKGCKTTETIKEKTLRTTVLF
ncbi:hypothetical protein J2X69_002710 [Algoriphagus sp. 4150]|uniref:hypothetical protein n=1 Tax=Algoriphagus sp. 4150 TaxID=2817756 RepID=UPI00285A2F84|nr:hypothetical protein [Algoriphagus sp. 4150]MDR7130360.1 hypothetical protein [Algoriphagus sp. 4150]